MRAGLLFVICMFVLSKGSLAQENAVFPFPKDTKRILFLGNSITYAGAYITDIETYLVLHYPRSNVEFINAGLPSETVAGLSEPGHAGGQFPRPDLHERLSRVLAITKPDVVFACYGINDGIYMPFDASRFKAYRDGMQWLHDTLQKNGVKKIVFVTPPVYDDSAYGTKQGYNIVLDKYAEWLLAQKDSLLWEVADIHFPMTRYLEEQRVINPSFKLAQDGVHPGETGQWLMAKAVLLYLKQDVKNDNDFASTISNYPNGQKVYQLISKRQMIMKDVWLTAAGHKRPGMNTGMPLPEAKRKYDSLELEIKAALR